VGEAAPAAAAEEAAPAARRGVLRRPGTASCRAAGDSKAAVVAPPPLRFYRCGPSPADLGSYRSGAGGVAAAEAKAAEAAAAARRGDLRRPGTAGCHAAGDGTAARPPSMRRRCRASAAAAAVGAAPRPWPPTPESCYDSSACGPGPRCHLSAPLQNRLLPAHNARFRLADARRQMRWFGGGHDSAACGPRCHLSVALISISARSIYPEGWSLQN
jgi:hypothetical protein